MVLLIMIYTMITLMFMIYFKMEVGALPVGILEDVCLGLKCVMAQTNVVDVSRGHGIVDVWDVQPQ